MPHTHTHTHTPQVITNIDVQSIEPVDQQMRDSLSKSVQMAIEISTKLAPPLSLHACLAGRFSFLIRTGVCVNSSHSSGIPNMYIAHAVYSILVPLSQYIMSGLWPVWQSAYGG